jgi:hypothetical protein
VSYRGRRFADVRFGETGYLPLLLGRLSMRVRGGGRRHHGAALLDQAPFIAYPYAAVLGAADWVAGTFGTLPQVPYT